MVTHLQLMQQRRSLREEVKRVHKNDLCTPHMVSCAAAIDTQLDLSRTPLDIRAQMFPQYERDHMTQYTAVRG